MTNDGVETATTYSSYGDTLAQSGTSGTVYGFTGEQEDSSTGLLYLRARYYSSSLRTFMGRDAWRGNSMRPMTFNGYVYGYNSPPNFTDPSGYKPIECPTQNCSPIPDLVEFKPAPESWTAGEKYQVNKAARDIARRLAETYNEYEYGYLLSPYLAAELYNCPADERPLTPSEAFLYYYGQRAIFYKTGKVLYNSETEKFIYGQYGSIPSGGVGINVYHIPKDKTLYLADPDK